MFALLAFCPALRAEFSKADLEFFERKVRPVLAEECLDCHGARKGESGLRLHTRTAVLRGSDFQKVVVPGDPDASLLLKAVRHARGTEPMPEDAEKLSEDDIAALAEWVKRGLPWPDEAETPASADEKELKAQAHWAFQPITDPLGRLDPPEGQHPIDFLVARSRTESGLAAAPEAQPSVLLRRLHYNLTGLPADPEEVARVRESGKLDLSTSVDRLLESPAYGERWARHWLDVARYADTFGYALAGSDNSYPYAFTYRDWVVEALNRDLPYDEFVRLQIAADQFRPEPDHPDLAALGLLTVGRKFLNKTPEIVDDQIDVLSRGLLGLTVSCARCHDHKYEAIPTKDYYALYGILESSRRPEELPIIGEVSDEAAMRKFEAGRAAIEARLNEIRKAVQAHAWDPKNLPDYLLIAYRHPERNAAFLQAINDRKLSDGIGKGWQQFFKKHAKDRALADWRRLMALPGDAPPERFHEELEHLKDPALLAAAPHSHAETTALLARQLLEKGLPELRKASPLGLEVAEQDVLFNRGERDKTKKIRGEISALEARSPGAPPRAMVLLEGSAKDARIRIRGGNRLGDPVPRGFLELFGGETYTEGSGRRQLAEAVTDPGNPLLARVIANRVWGWHFGEPLVRTPSDLGVQCEEPVQRELLDHLASYLRDHGWSLKTLHRYILSSATFRQSSRVTAEAERVDPENALLARMNRRRMDLEGMRDAILSVSGVLKADLGGRPVRLEEPASDARRTLYARIDRHRPHPLFPTFDLPNPDLHAPRRPVTSVPQQGLFLLNSPFVQRQADRLAEGLGKPGRAGVAQLYHRVLARPPSSVDLEEALAFLEAGKVLPETWTRGDWSQLYSRASVAEDASLPTGRERVPTLVLGETQPLGHFHAGKATWQPGAEVPDPEFGYLSLRAGGGHPGNSGESPIRRLTIHEKGLLDLDGFLEIANPRSDGVIGAILHSRHGSLLQRHVPGGARRPMQVGGVEVEPCDTIDFLVHQNGTSNCDSFSWVPTIRPAIGKATGKENRHAGNLAHLGRVTLGEAGAENWTYHWAKVARDEIGWLETFEEGVVRGLPTEGELLGPGSAYPDKPEGFSYLAHTAEGGHTGPVGIAWMRRWTADLKGTVRLSGDLARPSEHGDGVGVSVLHSRLGNLLDERVGPTETRPIALEFAVEPGDTIDLVVDPLANDNSDSFRWQPVLHRLDEEGKAVVASEAARAFEITLKLRKGEILPQGWSHLRTVAATGKPLPEALAKAVPVREFAASEEETEIVLRPFAERVHPETGHLHFSERGGHPGAAATFGVRRWTAPRDGLFDIMGTCGKRAAGGDGLTFLVVRGGKTIVARLPVGGEDTDTHHLDLAAVPMEQGETLDFVVLPGPNSDFDEFNWQPAIIPHSVEGLPEVLADAAHDFPGPDGIPLAQDPIRYPWSALAQTLLISNEFLFVE